jgi:hypothetical protein
VPYSIERVPIGRMPKKSKADPDKNEMSSFKSTGTFFVT